MAIYYFAGFLPAERGGYSVLFPDLPEAFTQGDDLADAMEMAEDALKIALEEYAREGKTPPQPSDPAAARALLEKQIADLGATVRGETLLQLVAAPDTDSTPVRVTMSLPRNVLAMLDRKAKLAGKTRSGYVASMALR